MKLQAEIEDQKYEIEFVRDGNNVTATVDGREYQVEATEPEPHVFLFKNDHKVSEITVAAGSSDAYNVRSGTHELQIKMIDPKRLRGSATDDATFDGTAEIRTAMPGKVVRIITPVGTEVEKGDGVVVVEAMKMQNELKSPKDGVVKEVRFPEGTNVNSGDILAVIE